MSRIELDKEMNRHPIIKAMIVGSVFVIVAEFLVIFIIPAWALSFPVGNYTIDLGELAPWAGVLIAFGVWWDARQARKAAAAAALSAGKAVEGIVVVQKQTDGLMKEVASLAKSQGQQQERADVATAKELVRTDRVADAEADARVLAAQGLKKPEAVSGEPVSVSDAKVAESSERAASALERTAASTEERNKR